MPLDTMFQSISNELVNEVLEKLRNESIEKMEDGINPMISKHGLAKELRKNDRWVKDYIIENPRYSTEIQSMIDAGLIQMKGYGEKTRVMINRKAIKDFLNKHSAELPWLEGK